MNRAEHILATISEECAEVSQRVTKAMRFTLKEVQPEQQYSNAERILHEYADLVGMIELAIDEGLLPDFDSDFYLRVSKKKQRFEKFLGRSAEHGALT